ncbi:MAG: ERF family protein [Candidatus Thermoplasmatota archaeon]|nr:ERF family protein [Candidatus Thermoplasmatota archaeon]
MNPEATKQEIATAEMLPAAPPGAPKEIVGLLEKAVEHGVDVESLEKLVTLYERVQDRQAKQEFNAAFAEFQKQCPMIPKRGKGKMVSKSGGSFSWDYAELDDIVRIVNPILIPLGFSYSWDSKTEGIEHHCAFTLRHVGGHSVSSRFDCTTDAPGAEMSGGQKNSKALTLARRQTIIQGLGLTACDKDTDGMADGKISVDQVTHLEDLVRETGANREKFLGWLEVKRMEDVRTAMYRPAVSLLEGRRKKS